MPAPARCVATAPVSAQPPNASSCMKRRSSDRCGSPSFRPPFSLRSGGSIRARPLSMRSLYRTAGLPRWPRVILQLGDMSTDERQAAQRRVNDLIAVLKGVPQQEPLRNLIEETEALARAIAAFHL